VISSDAFYAEDESLAEKLSNLGFYSIEMECAGLAAIGWMRGIETACVLYVTDSLVDGAKGLLGAERVNMDMVKIGEAVAEVLASL
jgi:5'-methylthioadenosine phosphorylase